MSARTTMLRRSAQPVVRKTVIPSRTSTQLPLVYHPQRQSHNLHTTGMLKEDQRELVKPQSEPFRPIATSGDYSGFGTDSEVYHCLDTDPKSETSPYEYPKKSGKQLRYGGMRELRGPWDGSWKDPPVVVGYQPKRIGRIL